MSDWRIFDSAGDGMTTREQLTSFHDFASDQLDAEDNLTLDELYSLWRAKHPTRKELADSVAALKAAYAEFQSGEPGIPAREALRPVCERLGLVLDD